VNTYYKALFWRQPPFSQSSYVFLNDPLFVWRSCILLAPCDFMHGYVHGTQCGQYWNCDLPSQLQKAI